MKPSRCAVSSHCTDPSALTVPDGPASLRSLVILAGTARTRARDLVPDGLSEERVMGYLLSVDARLGIVEIRLSNSLTHSEHVEARQELLEVCRARNIHKILVDARELVTRVPPSVMELFDFGVSWADQARGADLVVAGVLPRDDSTRLDVMFGDTVAVNRGLVSRTFDDIDEARTWLRSA
jgi:hypothetical protein